MTSKVLWHVETNFRRELTLDEIGSACGVSRFHMCRSFAATTGMPVMAYMRGRRLTEAARILAAGAPSILDVALAVGYGSHEAFTRAFRDWFGMTPEALREGRVPDQHLLVEPIRMESFAQSAIALDPPRRERLGPLMLVGLGRTYAYRDVGGIPGQWSDFQPYGGTLGEVPGLWYGISTGFNEEKGTFRYVCAVGVDRIGDIPSELEIVSLPAQSYLAFTHRAHVSEIRHTMQAIWGEYIPENGIETDGMETMFERYDTRFDARTGQGGFEIWLPVKD